MLTRLANFCLRLSPHLITLFIPPSSPHSSNSLLISLNLFQVGTLSVSCEVQSERPNVLNDGNLSVTLPLFSPIYIFLFKIKKVTGLNLVNRNLGKRPYCALTFHIRMTK